MKVASNLIILVCIINLTKSWRSYVLRFDDTACSSNSSIVPYINCSIGMVKRKQEGFNLYLKFEQDMPKPTLDIVILLRRVNQPDYVLVNQTAIDGCNFFENRYLFQILKIIREAFDQYSSAFPNKCPIKKNTVWNVTNMYINPEKLPSYIPECQFTYKVRFWSLNKLVFNVILNGSVQNKYNFNKKVMPW